MVDEQLLQIAQRGEREKTSILYTNKTFRFLSPTLTAYGETFVKTLRNFRYIGLFIEDLNNSELQEGCVILVTYPSDHMTTDYLGDMEILSGYTKKQYQRNSLLFSVVEIPDEFQRAYIRFLEGRYSEMFTQRQLDKYFPGENKSLRHRYNRTVRKVVQKDPTWRQAFEKMLNEKMSKDQYGSKINLDEKSELEFLPRPEEEIIFQNQS
jgi:hypothetical protein